MSDEQINKIVTKLISFINAVNDFIKLPFWLNELKQFVNSDGVKSFITVFKYIGKAVGYVVGTFGRFIAIMLGAKFALSIFKTIFENFRK